MASMAKNVWQRAPFFVLGGGAFFSQVGPKEARNHVVEWWELSGHRAPDILQHPHVDGWVTTTCVALAVVWAIFLFVLHRREKRQSNIPDRVLHQANAYAAQFWLRHANSTKAARDQSLSEGITYHIAGDWTGDIAEALNEHHYKLGEAENDITQAARDSEITVWGRPTEDRPFEQIPPEHWRDYMIDTLRATFDKPRTAHRRHSSDDGIYYDLMASRAEFERKWPR